MVEKYKARSCNENLVLVVRDQFAYKWLKSIEQEVGIEQEVAMKI
jgi:hypothetical protein